MNILIINIDASPQFVGGIKKVHSILAKLWAEDGHNVFFIAWCPSEVKYTEINGVRQIFFPDETTIFSAENVSFLREFVETSAIDIILNPFCDTREVVSLCANISSVKAKVISVLHFAPTHYIDTIKNNFFISEKLQLNLRLWVLDFIFFLRWIFFRKNKYTKEIYRELNNIILMSEHLVLLSNKFIDNLPVDFDKSKISVINNPVEIPTNSLLGSKEKCICWLGRVEFGVKRVDRMLKVWKIVSGYFPDWKLLICGSGDNVFFKKLASKMKLKNVTFYGFVNDIHDIYRRSRIVCNTSSTEAWGMTLVEGASYGCIPVAFDNFASVYDVIVNEKTGFIIKSFNYKEFAEKLMLLMRDPEMEFNMARCSVEHMKNFSKEKIARKYIALFQEILNKQYEKNSFSFSRSRE